MNDLRTAAQQALEALIKGCNINATEWHQAIYALRAALAQKEEPVAWEGWWLHHGQHNYRAKPLSPERVKELMKLAFEVGREATLSHQAEPVQEQAEPVQPGAWVASKDGRVIYDYVSTDDCLLRVSGDFENDEQRVRYSKQIVDKLNDAPAQQAVAAAELRRLHELLEAEQTLHQRVIYPELQRLRAQRDALLEALKLSLASHGLMLTSDPPQDAWKANCVEAIAYAAIKAVEGKKT